MAQSQTDICNSALILVGAGTIASLDDNSPEARVCSVQYDSTRRDELRKHPWNFAVKRVALAPDAEAPAFDYKYQFTLPSDCLRVLRNNDYYSDWLVEGGKILTNLDSTLYLRYIADIDNPVLFDASFYSVFAISLAIDICEKLTQSNMKAQLLAKTYSDEIKEARRANAIEGGPKDAPYPSTWTVRW